ncbi:hypothetical protein C5F59_027595 [Streptomyces sp. QL37]|uniref:hypothetical protein n=1 Tax=Streptomyces sp. QL37 TaxID=2093747 RepID=UPI000CF26D8D|nr:hypothetical protein [Streptomyces sp. QL37]PPQ57124.1 hypothetical protein C5F59_10845 [Streptomyces sp. QL37]
MDAGLAAVIAGAAGAGGAALAAFGTSIGLLRQAKMQGSQAHHQWLRDHQQRAYEELLVATDRTTHSCVDAMKAVRGELTPERRASALREETVILVEDVRAQSRALRAVGQRVALLADDETGALGIALCERVLNFVDASLDSGLGAIRSEPVTEERLEHAKVAAGVARSRFIEQASQALRTL